MTPSLVQWYPEEAGQGPEAGDSHPGGPVHDTQGRSGPAGGLKGSSGEKHILFVLNIK